MFSFMKSRAERDRQRRWNELRKLNDKAMAHEYEYLANMRNFESLPFTHNYDSLKGIYELIGHIELGNQVVAEQHAKYFLFRAGLNLFNKHDREYLQTYIMIYLLGKFGSLNGELKDVEVKSPDFDKVDDGIKSLFFLKVSN